MRRLAVVALLATALAAPVARAGCAAARSRAGWTLADAPITTFTAAGQAYVSRETTRTLANTRDLAAPGGAPGRLLSSDGVSVFRTTDSGCSWQRLYTIDVAALQASAAEPTGTIASAEVDYRIVDIGAPATASNLIYALIAYGDSFTGLALQEAGLTPFFLARSADGGKSWRTDLVVAPLAGPSEPTPVLGDGYVTRPYLRVSPADPRTVYFAVPRCRDPRVAPGNNDYGGAVYVTRDAAATWAFVTPQSIEVPIVPDPRDPLTFYGTDWWSVDAVTVGATPVRHRVLSPKTNSDQVAAIDATRVAGRPARLLVTTTRYVASISQYEYRVNRSFDGGHTWTSALVPAALSGSALYLSGWLTPAGDAVVVRTFVGIGAALTITERWPAAGRWRPPLVTKLPGGAGAVSSSVTGLDAADGGHRRLVVRSNDQKTGRGVPVVGTVDLEAL